MTDGPDNSSALMSGGIHRPTSAAVAADGSRRMLIRSLDTRNALPPLESLHALDWLNFFLAALLSSVGPRVAVYLADRGWGPADIGFIMTASGLAGLLTQLAAGELIDLLKPKRTLVGAGTATIFVGVLIFGLRPDFPFVFAAAIGADTGSLCRMPHGFITRRPDGDGRSITPYKFRRLRATDCDAARYLRLAAPDQ